MKIDRCERSAVRPRSARDQVTAYPSASVFEEGEKVTDLVLSMTGIEKRFGPVLALDSIDFSLQRGEIHALLGVNGAGKSTLVKILSGVYVKDAGEIEIDGRRVEFSTPRDAIEQGIASVQQHPELVDDLSGHENIFLGQEAESPGLFKRIDRHGMRDRAEALLSRFPVAASLALPVGALPPVEKEIVAVLHALRRDDIKILILDEPTSTLTEREKAQLFQMMRALKTAGIAIIYITHRLEEVFDIADRFTIFRGGRRIVTLTSQDASERGVSIAELMLDRTPGELYPPKLTRKRGEILLDVRKLSQTGAYQDISFSVQRGEILGIFGLVGSGIDELAKALFGATRPGAGEIRLMGEAVKLAGPRDALRRGVFLLPGERKTEGLTLTRSVTFNTTLANPGRASRVCGLIRFGRNREAAATLAKQVALHPPQLWQVVSAFSGGNQQKIVLAKGLFCQADIYIFVEPTVGVDIGARAKLYGLIRELSAKAAVVVMSSDCDEVFGLSDRVMALYRGRAPLDPVETITRGRLLAAGIMGAR
ncbi:sugar ABC transporter ATP-binding protein [Bradyrhizobium brasilense]|uniref:sugar ABC transporter ATP-binding protein n=1 Tax=Bradyrhizobium brasilense TaxID=1419277 RepID=UPI001FCD436F|nr:sugar ABC transporter ATP-binding protein [Bradyrhizobium brasilense]